MYNPCSSNSSSSSDRTMLSGSPLLCAYSQRPNMRNTAQVVLPVPERPSKMMELGGSGRSSMMRCSAGDTLNLKSTSLSFMPWHCTAGKCHLAEALPCKQLPPNRHDRRQWGRFSYCSSLFSDLCISAVFAQMQVTRAACCQCTAAAACQGFCCR
jgi:hypothetical protein